MITKEAIQSQLKDLIDQAHDRIVHADQTTTEQQIDHWKREINAARKAILDCANGVEPKHVGDRWMVPSASRAGVVHEVRSTGCSCEAGTHGDPCRHALLVAAYEMVEVLEAMADAVEREVCNSPTHLDVIYFYTEADRQRDIGEFVVAERMERYAA